MGNDGLGDVIRMLGAITFWLINGRKENYSYYDSEKFDVRNIWIGAVIMFVLAISFVFLIYYFSNSQEL